MADHRHPGGLHPHPQRHYRGILPRRAAHDQNGNNNYSLKICCFFENLVVYCFTFSVRNYAGILSKKQQMSGLIKPQDFLLFRKAGY